MKHSQAHTPNKPKRQFVFQLEAEASVLPKLFFAMQLENLLNAQLDLSSYSAGGSLKEIRVRFMAYKKLSISHREDHYRYRPEARYLEIGLEVDFEVLAGQEGQMAQALVADFLLFALEEYVDVPDFDHPRFLDDARSVLAPYLPADNEGTE